MTEFPNVRQIPGEPRRRWFSSDEFDLIVWLQDDGDFAGFELCYDRTVRERSIVWRPSGGFTHMAVDDGENPMGKHKAAPMLVADGHFDAKRVHRQFLSECVTIPLEIAGYVLRTIRRHPSFRSEESAQVIRLNHAGA